MARFALYVLLIPSLALLGTACFVSAADLDGDGDGYLPIQAGGADCDDDDPTINPGKTEVCGNNVDDNCDGAIDDAGDGGRWFFNDADGDGYGDPATRAERCPTPTGAVEVGADCDDTKPDVHPGALDDTCDGVDNDCDYQVDEDAEYRDWFEDADGDGYGVQHTTVRDCAPPDGFAAHAGDCEPNDPDVHPGVADDQCDGVDRDCSGYADEVVLGDGSGCPADSCRQLVELRDAAPDRRYWVQSSDGPLHLRCAQNGEHGAGWLVLTGDDLRDNDLVTITTVEGDARGGLSGWQRNGSLLLDPGRLPTRLVCGDGAQLTRVLAEVRLPWPITELSGEWSGGALDRRDHYGLDTSLYAWSQTERGCRGAVLFGTPDRRIKRGGEWGAGWASSSRRFSFPPTELDRGEEDRVRWQVSDGLDSSGSELVISNIELWVR